MSSTQQLLLGEGAGGGAVAANYIEDVFSTYLYTGNGATGQPIVNGIDLSTKGGLVWLKSRTTPSGSSDNNLYDTVRGASQLLISNSTNAQTTATRLSFQTTGFNLTNEASSTNESGVSYVSWTFREQPKFFDVVTYTGNGSTQTISHNLGSVPGCIIVKRLNNASNTGWPVYHRYDYQQHGFLNLDNGFTGAQEETFFGNNTISVAPTSTVFTVGNNQDINANTNTYVAYIFAHNAGGFGLTGTDNVISCGSVAGFATVNLGYEPQFVLAKKTDASGDWFIYDNMRGIGSISGNGTGKALYPNLSDAEVTDDFIQINSTGFKLNSGSGNTFIYIAIRRGPMKVPTSGTSVFQPVAYSGNSTSGRLLTSTITPDLGLTICRNLNSAYKNTVDRLRGANNNLITNGTAAETTYAAGSIIGLDYMTQVSLGTDSDVNSSSGTYAIEFFKRAPSFFDVVCYTGTLGTLNVSHNLGVEPELMIVKKRNSATNSDWTIYCKSLTYPNANPAYNYLYFTTDAGRISGNHWDVTAPTSSLFTVGSSQLTNASGGTFVNYLFATCAGVSKVGGYTGTGTTLQIDCGFTAGARFVLIKRTDSTGDWYVWDSARGIVAGNDPYTILNNTAVENTSTDYVDTYNAGFEISSTAPAAINASGGTFIFLAVS